MPSIRGGDEIRELMLRIRTISLRMALDQDPANIATYRGQMDTRDKETEQDRRRTTNSSNCRRSAAVTSSKPSPPIALALPIIHPCREEASVTS